MLSGDQKKTLRLARLAAIAEAKAKERRKRAAKIERQTEICYRQYSPPQVFGYPEKVKD